MTNNKKYSTFNPDITLQEIAEMYRDTFVGKIFQFDVVDQDTPIRVKFDESNLKHLIGLHYLYPMKGKRFRAEKMYRSMLDGSLTLEMLEKKNPQEYRKRLMRIQCFQLLPEVLKQSYCGVGTATGHLKSVNFFFFDEAVGRYLYLGVMLEENTGLYLPITFVENRSKKVQYTKDGESLIKGLRILDHNAVLDQ